MDYNVNQFVMLDYKDRSYKHTKMKLDLESNVFRALPMLLRVNIMHPTYYLIIILIKINLNILESMSNEYIYPLVPNTLEVITSRSRTPFEPFFLGQWLPHHIRQDVLINTTLIDFYDSIIN